jgi:hypothetical protein
VAYDLGWFQRGERQTEEKTISMTNQKTFSVGDDISETCQWPLMINNPTELTQGELQSPKLLCITTTRMYRMRS